MSQTRKRPRGTLRHDRRVLTARLLIHNGLRARFARKAQNFGRSDTGTLAGAKPQPRLRTCCDNFMDGEAGVPFSPQRDEKDNERRRCI